MHFLYYIIAFIVFNIMIYVIFQSLEWIKGNYKNTSELVRWVIFLPISITMSGSVSIALLLNTYYLFPLREALASCINWVAVPIFLFYIISLTIPRGKKVTPIILCALWVILGALSIINHDPEPIIRIIQVVALSYFMFLWAKTPACDFYK